jgi:hypothetical protein
MYILNALHIMYINKAPKCTSKMCIKNVVKKMYINNVHHECTIEM